MKLGYFTMPIHPPERDYTQTLKEDREAVLLADRLGYCEALIGEHTSDICETIPSCLSFIASVAHDTKQIRLGPGTLNLPNSHPAQVAAHVAMIDHMLEGRFILGIGPGGLRSDWEVFGNLDADRNAMFVECIEQILALWSGEPPYDLEGKFWKVSTRRTLLSEAGQGVFLKPYQKPHPEIVITVVAASSKGLEAAAARGWHPISANFIHTSSLATHWPTYVRGCEAGGLPAGGEDWRVARSIFVADDQKTARDYALDPKGAYGFYFWNLMAKRRARGMLDTFKHDPTMPDSECTLEYVLQNLPIYGTPESVAEQLVHLRRTVGPFGTLLYVGHDWVNPALAKHSMELMANEVMPRVNHALLEEERVRLNQEISAYPGPIPGCDAHFNHLLEKRARLTDEIARIERSIRP
jgi:alkanesulfonate monooxygenase SsuD/methylene tetrahydromethanopterin reductase-like flavin-dependent oxidoreductase (luciferase family)